ncbi:tyrosine-type recombinase/integrase [Paenibacillus andongensis]|uniref:tyrosine-type recombinase/integrase n=1 Tax=Paenibacillus andongensis TaxID=2975482 RepID=UPI0021BB97D1|nr:site-specific integrase [Paenibacillus andongensis]
MRVFQDDAHRFITNSSFTERIKQKYTKYLNEFGDFLSARLNQPIDSTDLERIYVFRDLSGMSLYGPLDAKLVDEYFTSIRSLNYFHIIETRYTLGSFFQYLERNYKFKNPIPMLSFDFKSLKPNKRPNRSLSKHELLRLLHTIITKSPMLERDLLLFTLLLSTGCRISEIVSLRIKDFEFESNIFKIEKTKNKKQRIGYLVEGMTCAILQYSNKQLLASSDYLFKLDEQNRLTASKALSLLHSYCDIAKIPHFTLHGTRHTFTTMMKEAGCDITTIQQILGHEPNHFKTTQRYIDENVLRNKGITVKENEELLHFLKTNKGNYQ